MNMGDITGTREIYKGSEVPPAPVGTTSAGLADTDLDTDVDTDLDTDVDVDSAPPRPVAERPGLAGALRVLRTATVNVAAEPGLLDPANPFLLDALGRPRRVVVPDSPTPYTELVTRYLDAQRARGLLTEHIRLPAQTATDGAATLGAAERLATAAAAAGLGRRDAFLVCGDSAESRAGLAAAALLRRHTLAVQVVAELPDLIGAVRGARRIGLRPRAAITDRRQVTIVIDQDRMAVPGAGPLTAAPAAGECAELVSFPVEFAPGLLDGATTLDRWTSADARVLAVVDDYSAAVVSGVRHTLDRIVAAGGASLCDVMPVTGSRTAKRREGVEAILHRADRLGLGSRDLIVAVGGGTVLDLVGTAALLYRGGSPYLRIPTTLVGMIDAGIGLKVAIDAGGRKNLLGGYHAPLACLCDPGFLDTLPGIEMRCGLAEAVKIAMVVDEELFAHIEHEHRAAVRRPRGPEAALIMRGAIRAMQDQLAANPYEQELRRLPDFGHEFGHLLEAASGFRLRHGEAVSVGMALSAGLAVQTGRLDQPRFDRFIRLLAEIGLPVFDPLCEPERLLRWLNEDVSANKGGRPHLVVPTGIGTGGFIDLAADITGPMLKLTCGLLSGYRR